MMDEAFLPLREALSQMLDIAGTLVNEEAGVQSHIYECTVELPIEMDVTRGLDGQLALGSVPPLYYVDTTYRPAYHRVRFTATRTEVPDDG